MIDPKQIAELDQSITFVREVVPKGLAALYQGCIAEGFEPWQAMYLTKEYLLVLSQAEGV